MICQSYEKAILSFRTCQEWQMVFLCAKRLNYSGEQIQKTVQELSESLISNQRFSEAAQVWISYGNEKESAKQILEIFAQGNLWMDAIQYVEKNQKEVGLEEVKRSLILNYKSNLEDNRNCVEDFRKKTSRLRVVQRNKFLLGNLSENSNNPEQSDNSSVISGMSAFSEASSVQSYSSQTSGYSGIRSLSSYGSRVSQSSEAKRFKLFFKTIQKVVHLICFFLLSKREKETTIP